MASFPSKNPNLGKFWRALECKKVCKCQFGNITAIWYILWQFLWQFYTYLYVPNYTRFGILFQRKIWQPW
jgi:hypothetical protein